MKAAEWADLALEHRYVEEDCGDHYVEACSCGMNRTYWPDEPKHEYGLYASHLREVFEEAAKVDEKDATETARIDALDHHEGWCSCRENGWLPK